MMMDASKLSLYLVTDRALAQERGEEDHCGGVPQAVEWIVSEAVRGGVSIVQLREKELDTKEFVQMGRRLKFLLAPLGVPLIINDRVDVALACDADGVHIGQSDMPYAVARGLLGPDKIIGLSIETFEQLEEANGLDVDYVAASPVFGTPTKTDTARPWGLDGLREFCRRSVHPVVAIGGINAGNAAAVRSCGADGLAVVSAIISAPSPKSSAAEIASKLARNEAKQAETTDSASKLARNEAELAETTDSASKLGRNEAELAETGNSASKLARNEAELTETTDSASKPGQNEAELAETTGSASKLGQNEAKLAETTDSASKLALNEAEPIGEFEMIDKIRAAFGDMTVFPGRNATPETPEIAEDLAAPETPEISVAPEVQPVGIGDDCAVIPQRSGTDTLISTDLLIEGVHFLLDDISPRDLGWKSAAVNISDIAAMGGRPTATFLSIALPENLGAEPAKAFPVKQKNSIAGALPEGSREEWINEFIAGYKEISERFGVPLMGGDTTSSKGPLAINVAILGEVPSGTAKLRSTAKPGDLICVTGTLGDSAAGLQMILKGSAGTLVTRHHRPMPRVREGLKLRECPGVHAMMDISDGIGSDLRHILKASGVSAEVDPGRIPLSEELRELCARMPEFDPYELACSGGEDYELLFTMAPGTDPGIPYTVIGRITEKEDAATINWLGGNKDFKGFHHF